MPFIPHADQDVKTMLERIQASDTEALFDEIPQDLRIGPLKSIPKGIDEMGLLRHAAALAKQNTQSTCFIGAGSYEHHIPAAVWDIATRGEFLTAYTPYQAEASQGTLQLLYEFQTMIAELTGMEVANASMYDGATALAEAILMAQRCHKNSATHRILIPATLHPHYRETIGTILGNQPIELITLPYEPSTGTTSLTALDPYAGENITALVIAQPNFFGQLEPVDELSHWASTQQIFQIACVNPTSLAILKPPGEWGSHGVDIVCGEGQPLGVPMASGGPYLGFFSTRLAHVRQMPGRLVGQTIDKEGKIGFTLTLQAREQHIRRTKATSNICTNQGLLVTAATLYLSLLGAEGLKKVAQQCHHNTHALVERLTALPGVNKKYSGPFFHEAVLQFQQPTRTLLSRLNAAGISGGLVLDDDSLLVCATEMRTPEDIQHYATQLGAILCP